MSRSRKALLQIPVVLLALASTPGLFTVSVGSFLNRAALAQSSETEPSESETDPTLSLPKTFDNANPTFTVPQSLAEDTNITVNGSSSMSEVNKALQERFVERFPDAEVELAATGTNEALEALQAGELDLAAVGRPLTAEEKAAGLVAVPIGREKLAIITGPNNPFDGDLTFEQFARMFRGEITNWSEVGGSDGEIRFVDRPDDSDTRRALSTYDVFENAPFESGDNTTQLSEDETDSVVAELGDDGVAYAIADQVLNRDDVKIIPMHKTLPDDPRYPYSQYRSYVYNENNTPPKVLAFLAFATSEPGQEIIAETEAGQPIGAAPAPVLQTPQETAQVPAVVEEEEEEETAAFPWWLLLLLAIPLIGALLWWLLRGGRGEPIDDSAATPPPGGTGTTTPPDTGTAAPTVPPITGTGTGSPTTGDTGTTIPPATGAAVAPTPTTQTTPVAPGTDLTTATPGTSSGTSVASGNVGATPPGLGIGLVGGGLAAGAAWWMGRQPSSRITLAAPGNDQNAYAYWVVPEGDRDFAKENGGQHPQLRVYDVTDIDDPDEQVPNGVEIYDVDESAQERPVHLEGNRDYIAEIGYITNDDRWLRLACSNRVRTPGAETTAETTADGATTNLGLAVSGMDAASVTALIPVLMAFGSHITLRLAGDRTAEAEWEVPDAAKAAAIEYGGRYPQLRICDVTDLDDLDRETPHSIQKYDWDESAQQQQFPDLDGDRIYLAEIGYITSDDRWLRLARSNRVRTPGAETITEALAPEVAPDAAGMIPPLAAGGAAALIPFLTAFGSHITLWLRDARTAEAEWEVPDDAKAAAIEYGGRYPQLRICDVTDLDDLDREPPHSIQKYDWDESAQQQQFPNLESHRIYLAEIGYATEDDQWLRLARSNRVCTPGVETTTNGVTPEVTADAAAIPATGIGGLAIALIPYLTAFGSHITLRVTDARTAEAEWEVPNDAKAAAIEHGGRYPQLRVCDVTDIDHLDRQAPHSIHKYDWDQFTQHQQFRNLESDRTYLVEIGYVTEEDQWLRLARSNRVRTPGVETTADELAPQILAQAGLVPELGVGGAAQIPLLTDWGSQITLDLDADNNQTADVRWEIPEAAKLAARERGGRQMQLRIYDVTGIDDPDSQTPNRVRRYDCEESTEARRVPISDRNGEYLAEIGYITDDGQWLMLGRSNRIVIPAETPGQHESPDTDTASAIEPATLAPLSSFPSYMTLIPTGEGTADIRWDISEEAKEVAKRRGGRNLQLRVFDVTNVDSQEPAGTPVERCDLDESTFDWQLELEGDRDYLTEVGYVTDEGDWLVLGRSNPVRVLGSVPGDRGIAGNLGDLELIGADLVAAGAVAGGISRRSSPAISSVTLIPSDNGAANVYWEVADAGAEDAQRRGGRQFQLHIYDVTDIPAGSVATRGVQQYDFDASIASPQLLQLEGDRDYLAEIGYLTADGEWLMQARSYRVRIPAASPVTAMESNLGPRREISLPEPEVVPTLDSDRCRVTLIPCDNEAANVYWEVPDAAIENIKRRGGDRFQLHIYDVTDIPANSVATNSVQQYDFDVSLPHPELLHLEGDRDYIAEIGYLSIGGEWLVLARSYRVRIPALTTPDLQDVELTSGGLLLPSLASIPCRIILTPGEEGSIDAEWEVPDAAKQLAKQQGGFQYQLRAYDVTNTSLEIPASSLIEQCPLAESISSWQFEFESRREYLAEVGYLTEEGLWLLLARSNRLYLPEETTDEEETGEPSRALTGVGETEPLSGLTSFPCYITLSPGENELVDARWQVPEGAKQLAKQRGGRKFQLHVYEVTGVDLDAQTPNSVQRYNCNELIKQWQIPNLNINCEYVVEIGYATDAGEWLMQARSNRIRVPATSGAVGDVTGVSPQVAVSSLITLALGDNGSVDAHWEVPRAAHVASKAEGGQKFQLRIYDVTGVDLETESAHNVRRYNCHELIQQLQIPNLEADRDYLAEIGYVADDEQWLMLARSNSLRISRSASIDNTTLGRGAPSISTVSQAASQGYIPAVTTTPSAESRGSIPAVTTASPTITPGNCAIQHLTVHSRRNCHLLDEERMKQLQETAVSHTLEPGIYAIRIKSGVFDYGSNVSSAGEPMVIFWIYGGKVINKKTRVPVSATWSTLNGFHDSLTLEVRETSTLCAFFFDTYPDENEGEVTVSVARLYDSN